MVNTSICEETKAQMSKDKSQSFILHYLVDEVLFTAQNYTAG